MSFDAPLHVLDNAALPSVTDAAVLRMRLADSGPSGTFWKLPQDAATSSSDARLGGKAASAWPFDRAPPPLEATAICLARDVLHFPAFGAVVDLMGGVHLGPSGEALHRWPDLSGLPDVMVEGGAPHLRLKDEPLRIERAALFLPWGAGFNYGHFVLDALTSLLMLEEQRLLDGAEIIAPPLKAWQRELLTMAFPGSVIRELDAPVVKLDTALYASSMNHFLHAPDATVARLARRLRSDDVAAGQGPKRIYLSRRGQSMRVMTNERALEAALERRGFVIARPEDLSPRQQIDLVRDAEVVVGPTGAALANAVFLPAGARVVEIQPENFTSRWVWAACRQVDVEWRGYVCRSPVGAWRAPLARLRRGFKFAYAPPLDDLLAFIDAAL